LYLLASISFVPPFLTHPGIHFHSVKYHRKTYEECFSGSELVGWFLCSGYAANLKEGVALARVLQYQKQLICTANGIQGWEGRGEGKEWRRRDEAERRRRKEEERKEGHVKGLRKEEEEASPLTPSHSFLVDHQFSDDNSPYDFSPQFFGLVAGLKSTDAPIDKQKLMQKAAPELFQQRAIHIIGSEGTMDRQKV
jgi:hypothetical protein